MDNRLQFFLALGGFGLGLITVYLPTWLLLRQIPDFKYEAFLKIYPQKRLQILLHELVAFLNLLIAPIVSIILLNDISPQMQPFFFLSVFANSIGIVNGVFECITGICPKRGINFRLSHKQNYIYHLDVRKAGLLRLGLGILFLVISLILGTGDILFPLS